MNRLGQYYDKLNQAFTHQGTGMVTSSHSLPLLIEPGKYTDHGLFPRNYTNPTELKLLATLYTIKINDTELPWPTLLPQDKCPLVNTRLKEINVDVFNHSLFSEQPVISCEACYGCPAFNMCQGTNISKIVNNSKHRVKYPENPFTYPQESLTKTIFKQALDQILRRVNWSQHCLAAMRDVARMYDTNQLLMHQMGSSFNNLNTELSSIAISA